VPGTGGRGPLGQLAALVPLQHSDGVLVEGDGAAACRRLGWSYGDPVAGGDPLLGDRDRPLVEVDVNPAQARGLAAAQPAQGDQPPQRVGPVVGDLVEECGEVAGGPYRDGGPLPVLQARTRVSVQT